MATYLDGRSLKAGDLQKDYFFFNGFPLPKDTQMTKQLEYSLSLTDYLLVTPEYLQAAKQLDLDTSKLFILK